MPFVKNACRPQNRFLPAGDSTLDLQAERKTANMENEKDKYRHLCLTVTLPGYLAGLPVRVEVDPGCRGIAFRIAPKVEENGKYVFVWNRQGYRNVAADDILWVEAAGSYSSLHLRDGHTLTVSFNLSTVEEGLPSADFVRIHRSYIVNMRHVRTLSGNCVEIGGTDIVIGRGYRKDFFSRFSFIGSRENGRKKRERE